MKIVIEVGCTDENITAEQIAALLAEELCTTDSWAVGSACKVRDNIGLRLIEAKPLNPLLHGAVER